jgi:hypothetical protein
MTDEKFRAEIRAEIAAELVGRELAQREVENRLLRELLTEIRSGGPAFPHEGKYDDGTVRAANGVTLRDYFATHAPPMTDQFWIDTHQQWPEKHWIDADSEWRFRHADAMLAERAKR